MKKITSLGAASFLLVVGVACNDDNRFMEPVKIPSRGEIRDHTTSESPEVTSPRGVTPELLPPVLGSPSAQGIPFQGPPLPVKGPPVLGKLPLPEPFPVPPPVPFPFPPRVLPPPPRESGPVPVSGAKPVPGVAPAPAPASEVTPAPDSSSVPAALPPPVISRSPESSPSPSRSPTTAEGVKVLSEKYDLVGVRCLNSNPFVLAADSSPHGTVIKRGTYPMNLTYHSSGNDGPDRTEVGALSCVWSDRTSIECEPLQYNDLKPTNELNFKGTATVTGNFLKVRGKFSQDTFNCGSDQRSKLSLELTFERD